MLRFFSFFTLIFGISSFSLAQTIRVEKVKGNRAIIETKGQRLLEGEEYTIQPKKLVEDVVYSSEGLRSRKNSISLGGSLESIQSTSNSGQIISLQLRYGWNFTTMEAGPYFKYESNNIYGVQTNAFAIGGFYDYNLKPNKDGVDQIWGLTGSAGFGSLSAGAGTGTNIIALALGGFSKWFIFGPQGALRTELSYKYEQRSRSSNSTTNSGVLGTILLSFYY